MVAKFCQQGWSECAEHSVCHLAKMPTRQKWWLRQKYASTNKSTGTAYFCHWGIFNLQICLIGPIEPLRSIIPGSSIQLLNINQYKLRSFYFIEFKEKSKMSKNTPKSTKPRKLKKHGPQPIKNHGKNHSVLEASKNTPGHKRVPHTKKHHTESKRLNPMWSWTHHILSMHKQRWY